MNTSVPKQFLTLGGRSILEITLEKFLRCKEIDCVLIGCNREWRAQTEQIAERIAADKPVHIIDGGAERWETLDNIVAYICGHFGCGPEDLLVTHDAVRPFVTRKLILEGIEAARRFGASCAAVKIHDTVAHVEGDAICGYPDRTHLVCVQTPQCFRIERYMEAAGADSEKKRAVTDATRIFVDSGMEAVITPGDRKNIKITTMEDYRLAEALYCTETE